MMGTANLGIGYVSASQNQKEVTINAGFDQVDAALCASLVVTFTANAATLTAAQFTSNAIFVTGSQTATATLTVPLAKRTFAIDNTTGTSAVTVGGTTGATVTVPAGALAIVVCNGTACLVPTSVVGATALATDDDVAITSAADGDRLRYSASAAKWVNGREPYIVAGFAPGILTGGQIVLVHKFGAAVSIPANFGTTNSAEVSGAGAMSNATGSTALSVDKCPAASDPTAGASWTPVGTITYGAGGHTATLTTVGGTSVSFAAGDKLRVVAPTPSDPTLAGVFLTLAGDR